MCQETITTPLLLEAWIIFPPPTLMPTCVTVLGLAFLVSKNTSAPTITGSGPVDKGRTKTPLEKWPLDALKLSLTVTGTASPMAMVEDPEKRGWAVHLGDFIGQNGGKVTGIHRDEIVVTETITDHSTGRVYPQNVKLSVPVTKDEERDIRALQEGEQLGPARGE